MALGSLADLKTAAGTWLDRSGDTSITNSLDDFIVLAEAHLNRVLNVREAVVNTTLTGSVDSRQLTLPNDFREPVALFLTTFDVQDRLAPIIPGNYALGTTKGTPRAWMINGSNIDLDVPCDQAHTFLFRYRSKLFDLADTDPNWLLTNHPDVYLSAVLFEAYAFMGERDKAVGWMQRRDAAIGEVGWEEARSKAVAPLRVDPALHPRGGFNINTGDYGGVS